MSEIGTDKTAVGEHLNIALRLLSPGSPANADAIDRIRGHIQQALNAHAVTVAALKTAPKGQRGIPVAPATFELTDEARMELLAEVLVVGPLDEFDQSTPYAGEEPC